MSELYHGILSARRYTKNDNTPCKGLTSISVVDSPDEHQNITVARGGGMISDDEMKSTNLQSTASGIIRVELRQVIREVFSEEFDNLKKELHSFEESLNFINAQFEVLRNNN